MGEFSGSLQAVREGLDALDISLEKCVYTLQSWANAILILR